jgi:hypothetical protein
MRSFTVHASAWLSTIIAGSVTVNTLLQKVVELIDSSQYFFVLAGGLLG